jgi:predicted Zn-dependent protease
MPFFPRPLAAALALTLAGFAAAQDNPSGLPDIGSSAGEMLSPVQEQLYGEMTLRELRHYGLLLEDPLIVAYLQDLGFRLVARSERPQNPFTFFMVRSRDINAFATLGGYVGMNAGLVLTAESEDEVAAVLAHEISHVTQRHVLRGAERAQKDALPIALAMLGAMIAAAQSGADGDAVQAAVAGGIGMMQQRQINYTRSNEHEADRIGIHTLARAGYDPLAMADFFARMERAMRGNQGGWQAPEYLRTHPVSTTRISEAKDRANQIQRERGVGRSCVHAADGSVEACRTSEAESLALADRTPINPLLPANLAASLHDDPGGASTGLFEFARERLRVLSATSMGDAVGEYQRLRKSDPENFGAARRYGLAIAQTQLGQTADAELALEALAQERPGNQWIELALAENAHRGGHRALAEQRYAAMLASLPRNRAVILSYARSLAEQGSPEAGRRAQDVLRPLLAQSGDDATFQQGFARASELAGDLVRAGEAYAENAYLNGRPEDALNQLERLKQRDDLDYYQRSRIDARIAAITPTVLEWRRRGLRPGDQGDGQWQDAPRAGFTLRLGGGSGGRDPGTR